MESIEQIYIWLSLIEEITYIEYKRLIDYFENVQNVYYCINMYEFKMAIISEDIAKKLIDKEIKEKAKKIYEKMIQDNVTIITYDSYLYNKNIKHIYMPPFVYYIKGKNLLEEYENKIVISGTRENTEYGENVCNYFSEGLLEKNYLLISTLVKGIDRISIKNAIKFKKKACVVCFTGFDKIINKEEKKLLNDVLNLGGMAISEYPYERNIDKKRFYISNRIVSGISDKILTIEAGKKSKVNILVDFAIEQGKEIYAVPGNIFSSKSYGTNLYIKEGAKSICCLEDILL